MNRISISDNKEKLNVPLIYNFLTNAYWAKGRTLDKVYRSINNSMCFGVYQDEHQIGFARVVTDKTIFAYLMDVFILETYRKRGYAGQLIQAIHNHEELRDIPKWYLKTKDAHQFYYGLGYELIEDGHKWMIKK
ncbi:MAG: GNAT family N-acetyltransferase [Saprospiraceae bacterium]